MTTPARHRYGRRFPTTSTDTTGSPPGCTLKPVAVYARVSSDKQEKEQTIDSRVDVLRRAAEERGWRLPPDPICTDDDRSGATLARPGLGRLRDLIA